MLRFIALACAIFLFGLNAPVFAQICCPSGCVQDANRCVFTGTTRTCASVPCSGGSSGSSGGSGGQTYVVYPLPPPYCPPSYPTPESRAAAANQCIATLSANAQLWGCLFEDDTGRAEDQRTGLSCPDRQKALANQCRSRCERYAASLFACNDRSEVWQRVFGDIGGLVYGSARVDLCGPRLKTSIGNLIRTRPSALQKQRSHR
jgi:hypothetical protein